MIAFFFILMCMFGNATAQEPIQVGQRGIVDAVIVNQESMRYAVKISNPTVFYIDTISIGGNAQSFTRMGTDSIEWIGNGSGILRFHGLALAGSDSSTMIHIKGIISDTIALDTSFILRITKNNTPLPYVRFSIVSENIPNPVLRGQATEWTYALDKPGIITISIITLSGRIIEEFVYAQDKGTHVFRFIPNEFTFHPGVYGMRLITEQGIFHTLWNVSP